MFKFFAISAMAFALALPASAEVGPFPASFKTQAIQTEGARLHVVVGGKGPAVVLVHGFGDTGAVEEAPAATIAAVDVFVK
jgi:hypothetical protein